MNSHETDWIGIAEMARRSGLSVDTLRWYEREGLIPAVDRGPNGRRRFSRAQQSVILLLAMLRDTQMPTSEMKRFVALMDEGAASHGRRIELLERHRRRLTERRAAIDAADGALADKTDHYRALFAQGMDCAGAPVSDAVRRRQSATS